ncbi:MAG: ATP-binding protein [Acidimicrobiaceae bacterium]|nr:ATP-binding protein [Acidimicrobiaceae bacterium]
MIHYDETPRQTKSRMIDQIEDNPLQLPSLRISGFRGIDHLEISRLGRVTLLTGRNGTCKTTVLDAVRIFADRGNLSSLGDILTRNEEIVRRRDEENDFAESLSFEALFHGRDPVVGTTFSIGPDDEDQPRLHVEISSVDDLPDAILTQSRRLDVVDGPVLKTSFNEFTECLLVFDNTINTKRPPYIPWSRAARGPSTGDRPDLVNYHCLGPGLLNNRELDRLWGEIALTQSESSALDALQLASNQGIDGVAVVPGARQTFGRRVVVKLKTGRRVPLRSLGDGAVRLFSMAIALANATGGFLLIDEAENGVHHSLQSEFWGFVFRAAENHNVQVIATTHSWDCIVGFAAAAQENESTEAGLIRLERRGDSVRATEYFAEDLSVSAAQGIEVR